MDIINSINEIEQLIFKKSYQDEYTLIISSPKHLNLEPLKRAYKTLTIKEKGISRKNKILLLHWTENIYTLSPFDNDDW